MFRGRTSDRCDLCVTPLRSLASVGRARSLSSLPAVSRGRGATRKGVSAIAVCVILAFPLSLVLPSRGAMAQEAGVEEADVPEANVIAEASITTNDVADSGTADAASAHDPGEGNGSPHAEAPASSSIEGESVDALNDSVERPIHYFLERIEVVGNERTQGSIIRRLVPLSPGELLNVDDPAVEALRWRLLGTGYFDSVELSLRKGERRGWVVLVIRVRERNTFVIQQIAAGISLGVVNSRDASTDVLPYAALTLAETNLFGLGKEVSAAVLLSERQQGVRLQYSDPLIFDTAFRLDVAARYANALEFFGNRPLVSITCPPPDVLAECPPEVQAKNAVVLYNRHGLSLGTGSTAGTSSWWSVGWDGDLINVRVRPDAASEVRGGDVDPIDFAIDDGLSLVSSLRVGFTFDRRDDPALPTDGTFVNFRGDWATPLFGSDYPFLKLQGRVQQWIPLPAGKHHLRIGAFLGVVSGRAPFFHRFHVADLTDLIPSRVLEMNIDQRGAPNVLGTAIREVRSADLAARIDAEYGVLLYRGGPNVRGVDAYVGAGFYAMSDRRDLIVGGVPGYTGWARVPVDLTFDVGIRMDTVVGTFQFGLSSALGFFEPLAGVGD